MKLIGHGAEAKLYLDSKTCNVVKRRIEKTYRIKEIDKNLRKKRTRREGRILEKLEGMCPKLIEVDEDNMEIVMEYLEGPIIKDVLDKYNKKKRSKIMEEVGINVGKMHDKNVIHGDLTTSNMIIGKEVKLIDFGLSFVTDKAEHKAVDIHLFKQALESKHYRHYEGLYESFLNGYKKEVSNYSEIINRLDKVEKRGRYKQRATMT